MTLLDKRVGEMRSDEAGAAANQHAELFQYHTLVVLMMILIVPLHCRSRWLERHGGPLLMGFANDRLKEFINARRLGDRRVALLNSGPSSPTNFISEFRRAQKLAESFHPFILIGGDKTIFAGPNDFGIDTDR